MKWGIIVAHAGNTFVTLLYTGSVRGFVNALVELAACVLSRARRPGFNKRLLPSKGEKENVSVWITASVCSDLTVLNSSHCPDWSEKRRLQTCMIKGQMLHFIQKVLK